MVKVIEIDEIDTKELFETVRYLLGDGSGRYFVVDGDLYLGRYQDRERAQEHADNLNSEDS